MATDSADDLHDQVAYMRLILTAWLRERKETLLA